MSTEHLIHVPGQWRCPKCDFQLTQSNLNAIDGTVTPRDETGSKCPNCNSQLWRMTWKDRALEAEKMLEDFLSGGRSQSNVA